MVRIINTLLISIFAITFSNVEKVYSQDVKSFLDEENIEMFIYENFDLRTIRSSFGPRRISSQHNYLHTFGLPKPTIQKNGFYTHSEDWQYIFEIIGIKDYNDDGFKDVFVCFTDDSLTAFYYTRDTILMTKYNNEMPLIALDYKPNYEGCDERREPPSLKEIEQSLERWRQSNK